MPPLGRSRHGYAAASNSPHTILIHGASLGADGCRAPTDYRPMVLLSCARAAGHWTDVIEAAFCPWEGMGGKGDVNQRKMENQTGSQPLIFGIDKKFISKRATL